MIVRIIFVGILIALTTTWIKAFRFLPLLSARTSRQFPQPLLSTEPRCRASLLLQGKVDSGSGGDEQDPALQELRSWLEASWNTEAMGSVPTNPESAADAAASSLLTAMNRKKGSIFLVDVLLPSYDITQGSNRYDDVLAVEFCIALALGLPVSSGGGKSLILMRDDKSLQRVKRILDARDRYTTSSDDEDEDDILDDDDEEGDDDLDETIGQYNDGIGKTGLNAVNDVDSFRQKLISGWDAGDVSDDITNTKPISNADSGTAATNTRVDHLTPKRYRLASMFGNATLRTGADRTGDAIQALKTNGKPTDDEGAIILLSAISPEEMVCIRALASSYGSSKILVLVNCKVDPLPVELIKAETVYSILPLIARSTVSDQNIFGKEEKPETPPPKVVVLRRYPRDWEVHVDVGEGFELAASVSSKKVGKKGPNMEWIAGSIKRHLQSRFG